MSSVIIYTLNPLKRPKGLKDLQLFSSRIIELYIHERVDAHVTIKG